MLSMRRNLGVCGDTVVGYTNTILGGRGYVGLYGVSIGAISALGRLPSIVENPCFLVNKCKL